MATEESTSYRYWAFISYSRQNADWAKWLHHAIETYGIPAQLSGHPTPVGEPAPARFQPIFKDRDDLPAASDLHESVLTALRESRYLIVICSPEAAASEWVNREINEFVAMGRSDRVLAIIVDGEPPACFPPALRAAEPIAADARPVGDGRLNAKLKLLAGMLGVGFDALRQREATRRVRRLQSVVSLTLALAVCFAILAVYAIAQRQRAVQVRTDTDLHEGVGRLRSSETSGEGMAYLARAARDGHHPLAIKRLWTLVQQRSFWVDVPSTGRAPSPTIEKEAIPPPFLSSVSFGSRTMTPTWVSKSQDGSTWVSVINDDGALNHFYCFRLWSADGVPITDWLTLSGPNDIRSIASAHLSKDGKSVAIVANVWREPQKIFLYDVNEQKFGTREIDAEGESPARQFARFTCVRFAQNAAGNLILLTGSALGDADTWSVAGSLIERETHCPHAARIVDMVVSQDGKSIASVSSDRKLMVTDTNPGFPIGLPIELDDQALALELSGGDGVRVSLVNGNVAEYALVSPLTRPTTLRFAAPHVDDSKAIRPADDDSLPPPNTVIAQSGGLTVRLKTAAEVEVVESDGRTLWSHQFPASVFLVRFDGSHLVVQTDTFATSEFDARSGRAESALLNERLTFDPVRRPTQSQDTIFSTSLALTRSRFYDAPNMTYYWFTVWDQASGLELCDPVRCRTEGTEAPGGAMNAAMLSADEGYLLVGDEDGQAVLETIEIKPNDEIQLILPDLAEALGGLRISPDGTFDKVGNRMATIQSLRDRIR